MTEVVRHPGAVLRDDFLVPLGLTAGEVARRVFVPRSRIERIVEQRVGISADTGLRLSRLLRTPDNFWTDLSLWWALSLAEHGPLDGIVPLEVDDSGKLVPPGSPS